MPGFPMASVASALDVLALANYVAEDELYAWSTLSPDGQDVLSMNGLRTLLDHALADAPEFDTVIVCCGLGGHRFKTPAILSWLRERHARGTVHWEDLDAFRETFPELRVTSEIFEVDGRIFLFGWHLDHRPDALVRCYTPLRRSRRSRFRATHSRPLSFQEHKPAPRDR